MSSSSWHITKKYLRSFLRYIWRSSGLSRALRKWKFRLLRKKRDHAIRQYGLFGAQELIRELRRLGINEGDTLFVQCSFNDLYTFDSSPLELLKVLKDLVGNCGTLLMPSYTNPEDESSWCFDQLRTPTYTGIISELFRRTPGVKRSLHPRHSICSLGTQTEYLLSDHENCLYADGAGSPFDKLRKQENSRILTLGLPPGYVSILHWVEDIEPDKLPFQVHEDKPSCYLTKRADGRIVKIEDHRVLPEVARRVDFKRFSEYLSDESYQYEYFYGIPFGLYNTKKVSIELQQLRDTGVLHYFL